mmetsp:Transcript_23920/g.24149  ORF Transcript_23920/g.24149 Transcript_23920/m.24149 type:complete len:399 (+) Transcript_23920:87-1283(+)
MSVTDFDLLLQDNMFCEDNASTSGEDSSSIPETIENSDMLTDNRENAGRWTNEEHDLFLEGLRIHGKGWKKIAMLIKSRSVIQVRTHAQKYFLKMAKAKQSGLVGEITMDGTISSMTALKKPRTSTSGEKRTSKKNKASETPENHSKKSLKTTSAPLSIGIGSVLYENPKLQEESYSCISPSSITDLESDITPCTNAFMFDNIPITSGNNYNTSSRQNIPLFHAQQLYTNHPEGGSSPSTACDSANTSGISGNDLLLYQPIPGDVDISFDAFCNLEALSTSPCEWEVPSNDRKRARTNDEENGMNYSSSNSLTVNGCNSIQGNIPSTTGINHFNMLDHNYHDSMFLGVPLSQTSETSVNNVFNFGSLNDADINEDELDDDLFTQDLLALGSSFLSSQE